MKTDIGGLHRYLSGVGALLLFWPSFQPGANPRFSVLSFNQRLWGRSIPIEWTLFAAVVMAFAFCWRARLHLGKLWSGFATLKTEHRVVDTGPYNLVRHPIYSGVIFAALMTAMMRASPAALAGAALIALGFSLTARIEERFLSDNLGAGAYDQYRGRVDMLAPRLK